MQVFVNEILLVHKTTRYNRIILRRVQFVFGKMLFC